MTIRGPLKRSRRLPIGASWPFTASTVGDPVTIAIFGSCVTRDLFEDAALRPTLGLYAARTSVISAVAPPLGIEERRVRLSSDWQRRCVVADFRKTFFSSLAALRPEWLVLDLIDERFDLLRTHGSLVTRSSAFAAATLEEDSAYEFEYVKRGSPAGRDLFERAAVEFADRVMQVVPPERIVLHRALWCMRYQTGGRVRAFEPPRSELCLRQNAMLEHGYRTLSAAFGERATTLELDPAAQLADADHRWALEPYHYEPAYNRAASARLQGLFGAG